MPIHGEHHFFLFRVPDVPFPIARLVPALLGCFEGHRGVVGRLKGEVLDPVLAVFPPFPLRLLFGGSGGLPFGLYLFIKENAGILGVKLAHRFLVGLLQFLSAHGRLLRPRLDTVGRLLV
ncbi:MAG: hypothetical protein M2R45_05483 [Verrucomicrobia subdivision 3 bacterium]|nr:hypothetical protein [Limisphaerales bacterium]